MSCHPCADTAEICLYSKCYDFVIKQYLKKFFFPPQVYIMGLHYSYSTLDINRHSTKINTHSMKPSTWTDKVNQNQAQLEAETAFILEQGDKGIKTVVVRKDAQAREKYSA